MLGGLCLLLAAACSYDYRDRRIPNGLILLTAVAGAVWRLWKEGLSGAFSWLAAGVLVMVLLYPLFKIGVIGAGDVKLLGMTAGYLPSGKILYFLFFSLLVAAMISLIKMWKEKNFGRRWKYLAAYLEEVSRSGRLQLYLKKKEDRSTAGICLSGPILLSVLLYVGGVY